jgi:hypothetical protein
MMITIRVALVAAVLTCGIVTQVEAGFLFGNDNKQNLISQNVVSPNTHTEDTTNTYHEGGPLATVPEPATVVLLASGLAGLGLWKLKKKR